MKKRPFTRSDKKAKIRRAIIQAAVDLFEKQGFENTSVDEIAAEAEISRSTFYRYFPTKEHTAFPYHQEYVARFRSLLAENGDAGSPLLTVRRAFMAMAKLYMAARDEHRRYQCIISSSPTLLARSITLDLDWQSSIADAWGKHLGNAPKARQQAGMAAGAIMGVVNFTMSLWYDGGCRQDLSVFGDMAFDLLRNGLDRTEKQNPSEEETVSSEAEGDQFRHGKKRSEK
jgi:AcrR family transcriptional regulator